MLRHVARHLHSLRGFKTSQLSSTTLLSTRTFTSSTSFSFSSDNKTKPTTKKRMTIKEIQELQAKKMQGQQLDDKEQEPMIRGADGFLDYVKVPPPWKDRKPPYKPIYLYEDINWIVRKSDKAHYVLGGGSIVIVSGMIVISKYFPMLLL